MEERTSSVQIAVSGEIGSGKSSVARILSQRLSLSLYSTGGIQRRIAESRGMSTLELNLFAEKNPEIDQEIDGFTIELGKGDESFVMDSRLAWHFLPRAFKVNLLVDLGVAAQRILKDAAQRSTTEVYASHEKAEVDIRQRRSSERRRFIEKYDVDIADPRSFDAVIDTSAISAERVAEIVEECLTLRSRGDAWHRLWLCPEYLVPIEKDAGRPDGAEPEVVFADERFFVLTGHGLVREARSSGEPVIATRLAGAFGDEIVPGVTVDEYVGAHAGSPATHG